MTCKENTCEFDDPTQDDVAEIEQALDATFFIAKSKQLEKLMDKFYDEFGANGVDFEFALLSYVLSCRKIYGEADASELVHEFANALEISDYVKQVYEADESE